MLALDRRRLNVIRSAEFLVDRHKEKSCGNINWEVVTSQIEGWTRALVNLVLMFLVTYFIFTIDKDGTETTFTQVRSFTSLIILINIDNILAPTAGVIFSKLRLFEHKSIFEKEGEHKPGDHAHQTTM